MTRLRFTVGSVAGGATQAQRRNDVTWYVHDHAYCCRVVRTFRGCITDPEAAARAYAHKLNAMCDPERRIV